ncbi:MAG TPA: hypothetical protein VGJ59_04275 [Jatrophihabitantaceae bacterium]|jgi:hypothetical protein
MRSEDELRAAFQQKAAEAPHAADVLRALRAHEGAPRVRRRWLVPAAAFATIAVAVGVPLAIALSHPSTNEKVGGGAQPETAAAGPRVPESSAAAGGQAPQTTGVAICRPADVTVALRGAVLTVTSRGAACELARVPAVGLAGRAMPKPPGRFGVLAAGATATSTLQGQGRCAALAGPLQVDWGAGPVRVSGATTLPSCLPVGALQASAFTGLH